MTSYYNSETQQNAKLGKRLGQEQNQVDLNIKNIYILKIKVTIYAN